MGYSKLILAKYLCSFFLHYQSVKCVLLPFCIHEKMIEYVINNEAMYNEDEYQCVWQVLNKRRL